MGKTLHYLDYTCPTPEENLALDDALLEYCETHQLAFLRTWEPNATFVVLGRSRKIQNETLYTRCTQDQIRILRRQSGGGTILQLPGCLNFSVILPINEYVECKDISSTTTFILSKHQNSLKNHGITLDIQGSSDLTFNGLKVAGHAQRRLKKSLLFHGCFLLQTDLKKISHYLAHPQDEPAYRQKRLHKDFITNLNIPSQQLKTIIQNAWSPTNNIQTLPKECNQTMKIIIKEKYESRSWNHLY